MPLFLIRDRETKEGVGTVHATAEEDLWWDIDGSYNPFQYEYAVLHLDGCCESKTIRFVHKWFNLDNYSSQSYGMGVRSNHPSRVAYSKDVKDYGAFPSSNPKNPRNGILPE